MEKSSQVKAPAPHSSTAHREAANPVSEALPSPDMLGGVENILMLQRLIGNQAVQRLIQRDTPTGEPADGMAAPSPSDPMHLWLARGPMPGPQGVDVIGPGGIGGFNARFEPDNRTLFITVRVGFSFLNGLNVDTSTGVVTPNTGTLDAGNTTDKANIDILTNQAATINGWSMSPAQKVTWVQQHWQWGSGETDTWLPQFRQTVEQAWGERHFFACDEFPNLLANVRVIADVHAGAQPNDHCQASIFKMPPNEFFNANVQHGAGDNARDERLFMSSGDIMSGRSANLNRLHHKLYFENNSADISASSRLPGSTTHDGRAFLQEIKTSFDAASATGGVQIQLVGHASSVGTTMHNQGLSEQRAANVEAELRSLGLVGHINRTIDRGEGETGAANVAEWRRVDIIVGSGEQQNTAAHEFGHMLGLGDEYFLSPGGVFRGNSAPLGSAATHNNVNNRVGDTEIDGAVVENNDGIMSLGNTVRPQHYATFHFALEHVTGKRWRYGGEGNAPSVIPGTVVPGGGVIT